MIKRDKIKKYYNLFSTSVYIICFVGFIYSYYNSNTHDLVLIGVLTLLNKKT